jgi:nicotinate-nucleotide adenylyltransferase
MRRGWFGGTFDPVHVGHLDVARAARRALALDQVLLVPANAPPHRGAPQASAAHRFAMAALAVQHEDGLLVSDLEMLATGPSYTSATLDRLAACGLDPTSLFLITGADAFGDIATWKDYPALLDRCQFVVVSRPGAPAPGLRAALPALAPRMTDAPNPAPAGPRIHLVDAPTAPVSSTEIRRRVAAGLPIGDLVPPAVSAHIIKHGLYRVPPAPGPARNPHEHT